MKQTDYKFNEQSISYEITDNGYSIYLDGNLWITQYEPYIPYPDLGYEGSCLKQIGELATVPEQQVDEVTSTENRLSSLEEENAMLSATLDDILTNVIPAMTGAESEVN